MTPEAAARTDLILNQEKLLRQQESLRAVVESISSELELRPLLTRIVCHACELIGADNGTIGLVDEYRRVVRTEAAYQMPANELGAEMPPGVGLAGQVFLTQKPLLLNRYGDVDQPILIEHIEHAVIGVPIFWRDKMIGFFGIGSPPPRCFDARDVETLTLFARHAAIAIENARLFEAEKRRATHIATINRIGQLITSGLNLDQLLQSAVEAICDDLHLSSLGLGLVDPENPEMLVLRAATGIYAAYIPKDYRQSIHEGICGVAARSQQSVLLNDVSRDPRYIPTPGIANTYAELAVPVVIGDRLLGVLNVEATHPITDSEVAGLEIVAHQLAVAIENVRLFSEIQDALDQTRLLYATSQRISTAMKVDEVIQAYLEQVAARNRYACSVVLYEFDEAGQRTAIIVQGRWSPQDGLLQLKERLPYARDALDPLLDTGQTVTMANVHTEPRASAQLRQLQVQDRRPALAFIPLMVRGQRIGLVVLTFPQVHAWQEADLQPYQTTAAQLATAIGSRRQYQLLNEQGRQIAVLQERQRLARDLHDSVTQLLFSITLIAQSINPAWQRNPAEGERRVNRLLELSQSALSEMRALLAELRPLESAIAQIPELVWESFTFGPPSTVQLRQDGLVTVLHRYIAVVAPEGLQIQLDPTGYTPQPFEQEEALYRITQEALNNAVKHAHARQVKIKLSTENNSIQLVITDDGRGFASEPPAAATASLPQESTAGSPESREIQGSLGLITMRERAEALHGTINLISAPGKGTTVTVTIPRGNR